MQNIDKNKQESTEKQISKINLTPQLQNPTINSNIKKKISTTSQGPVDHPVDQNLKIHYHYLKIDYTKKCELMKQIFTQKLKCEKNVDNFDTDSTNTFTLKQKLIIQQIKQLKQEQIKTIKQDFIKIVKKNLIKLIQQKSIDQITQNINSNIQVVKEQIKKKLTQFPNLNKLQQRTQKILTNFRINQQSINSKFTQGIQNRPSRLVIQKKLPEQLKTQEQKYSQFQNLINKEEFIMDHIKQKFQLKESQKDKLIKQIIQKSVQFAIQELMNKFIKQDSRKLTKLTHFELDRLLKEACYGFKIQGENLVKRSQNIYNLKKFIQNPVDQSKFLKQFCEKFNEILIKNNDQFSKNLSDLKFNVYLSPLIQLQNIYKSKIEQYKQDKKKYIINEDDFELYFIFQYLKKHNNKNAKNLKTLFYLFENSKKLVDKYKDNILQLFMQSLTKITPSEISQDNNKLDIRKIFQENKILRNILNLQPKCLDQLKTQLINFNINKKKIQQYKQQKQMLQIKLKSNYNESHIKSLNELKEKISKQQKDNYRKSQTKSNISKILKFQQNFKKFQNYFYGYTQHQQYRIRQQIKKHYLFWKKKQQQFIKHQQKDQIYTFNAFKQRDSKQQKQKRNQQIQQMNRNNSFQKSNEQYLEYLQQMVIFYTYFYRILKYITQLAGEPANLINSFSTPDEDKCKKSCGCYIQYLLTQNVFVDQFKTQIVYADSLVTSDVRNFIQATSVLEINLNSLAKLKNQLNYDVKNQTKASKLIKKKLLRTTIGYITISKQIFKNIVCDRVINMYNEIEISNNQTIQKIANRLLHDYGEFVAAKCNVGIYYLQYSQQKQMTSMKNENFSVSMDVSLPSNLQAQGSGGKHKLEDKNKKLRLVSKIYFKQPKIISRQKYKISVSYTSDKIQGKIDQARIIHRLSSKYYLLCGEYLNQKREIINLYFSGDIYYEFIRMIQKEQQNLKTFFMKETDFKQLQSSILQLDLQKYGDNLDAVKQWKFGNEMRQSKALLKLIAEIIPKFNTNIDKQQLEKLKKYVLFFDTPQKIFESEKFQRYKKLEQQLNKIMATLQEYEKKLFIKDKNKVVKNIFIREAKNELKQGKKCLKYIKSFRFQIQNYYESNKSIKYFDELVISDILAQVKKMQQYYEKMQNNINSQLEKLKFNILNKLTKIEYKKQLKQRFREQLLDNILSNQVTRLKFINKLLLFILKSSQQQKLIEQILGCIINTEKNTLTLDILEHRDPIIVQYVNQYLTGYFNKQINRNSYIQKFKQIEQIIYKNPIKRQIQIMKHKVKQSDYQIITQIQYHSIKELATNILSNTSNNKEQIFKVFQQILQYKSLDQIYQIIKKPFQTHIKQRQFQEVKKFIKKYAQILSQYKLPDNPQQYNQFKKQAIDFLLMVGTNKETIRICQKELKHKRIKPISTILDKQHNNYLSKRGQLDQEFKKLTIKIQGFKSKKASQDVYNIKIQQNRKNQLDKLKRSTIQILFGLDTKQIIKQMVQVLPKDKKLEQILIFLEKLLDINSQSKQLQNLNQNIKNIQKKKKQKQKQQLKQQYLNELISIINSNMQLNRQILIHHMLDLNKQEFITFYVKFLARKKIQKKTQQQLMKIISQQKFKQQKQIQTQFTNLTKMLDFQKIQQRKTKVNQLKKLIILQSKKIQKQTDKNFFYHQELITKYKIQKFIEIIYLQKSQSAKAKIQKLIDKVYPQKPQNIFKKIKMHYFILKFKNIKFIDKIVQLLWRFYVQNEKKYLLQYFFEVKDSKSKLLFKKYLQKNYDCIIHKAMLGYMKINLEKVGCPLDQKNQMIQKIITMKNEQINKIFELLMLYEQDNIIKQIMTDYFIADQVLKKKIKTKSQNTKNQYQLIQLQQAKSQLLLQYFLKGNIKEPRNLLYQHLVNHLDRKTRNLIKQKLYIIVNQKKPSTSFTYNTLISVLLEDEFYRQFWIEFLIYQFLQIKDNQQLKKLFIKQLIKVSKNDQKIRKKFIQFVTQYNDQFFFNILKTIKVEKILNCNQEFQIKQRIFISQNKLLENQLKEIRKKMLNEQFDSFQLLEQYFYSYVKELNIIKLLCEIVCLLSDDTIKQVFKRCRVDTYGYKYYISNTVDKSFFTSQIDKGIKFQFQKQLISNYDNYKQFFQYYVEHLWNKKIFKKIIYELPIMLMKQIIIKSKVNFIKIIIPTYSNIQNQNLKSIFMEYIFKPQQNNNVAKNLIENYMNQQSIKNIFTDYLTKNEQGQEFLQKFLLKEIAQKSYIIQNNKISYNNIVQYLLDKDNQQKQYKNDYFLTKLEDYLQTKVIKINQLKDQLFQIGLINDMNIAVDSLKKLFGNPSVNNPFKKRHDEQLSILANHYYEQLLQKSSQIDQYRISQLIKRRQATWENKFNINKKQRFDKYQLQYQLILWLKHFLKKLSIRQRNFKAYDYNANYKQFKNYAIRFKDLTAYEDQEGVRYLKGVLVSQTMEMYCKLKYHNRLGLYNEEDKNMQIELEQVELNPVNTEPYYFLKYNEHNNFSPSILKITKQCQLHALFYLIESDEYVKKTL